MSKEYVCDSCKEVMKNPHDVKMKEFYIRCSFDFGRVLPYPDTRKVKIHLCNKCFLGLKNIADKEVKTDDSFKTIL